MPAKVSSLDVCPRCGEVLEYDEADVGVGVIRGNERCAACFWVPGKSASKNDRDRFCALMLQLSGSPLDLEQIRKEMNEIVGRNQNGGPNGADGSFTEPQWVAARDLVQGIYALDRLFGVAQRTLQGI